MNKIIIYVIAALVLPASWGYAAKTIEITEECVYLDQLTAPSMPHSKVTCSIAPGESKTFSKESIQNYLARAGIKATVMNDVIVTREGEKLSQEDIVESIENEYKKAYPEITVAVDQIRLAKDVYAEKQSDFKVTIDTSKFGANYAEIDNGIKKAQIYVYIKAFREGYVTTERIRVGESMEGKIRTESIDVTNLKSALVTNPKGLISSKMIGQGRPITEDVTTAMPALKKGQTVTIVYDNGNLKIEATGVIEADAFVGKSVPVRNTASQKVITANYIGGGVVVASF